MKPIVVAETEKGRVKLTYPHLPDFELKMDFNPIIDKFHLAGSFCLVHWQAKPLDKYYPFTWNGALCSTPPRFLQIDEELVKSVPTAALLFLDTTVVLKEYLTLTSVRQNAETR
ncbi:MAG: hypothetical protein JGK29_32860 [Microcoleus sp. PH2017_17_BER_D_A]|nr:hypothetical protein [Microcoleus sp. PH2017_17_BER_D_A]